MDYVLLIHSGFSLTPKLCHGSCFGVACKRHYDALGAFAALPIAYSLYIQSLPALNCSDSAKLLLLFVLVYTASGAYFGLHYWRIMHLIYDWFITGVQCFW